MEEKIDVPKTEISYDPEARAITADIDALVDKILKPDVTIFDRNANPYEPARKKRMADRMKHDIAGIKKIEDVAMLEKMLDLTILQPIMNSVTTYTLHGETESIREQFKKILSRAIENQIKIQKNKGNI